MLVFGGNQRKLHYSGSLGLASGASMVPLGSYMVQKLQQPWTSSYIFTLRVAMMELSFSRFVFLKHTCRSYGAPLKGCKPGMAPVERHKSPSEY